MTQELRRSLRSMSISSGNLRTDETRYGEAHLQDKEFVHQDFEMPSTEQKK